MIDLLSGSTETLLMSGFLTGTFTTLGTSHHVVLTAMREAKDTTRVVKVQPSALAVQSVKG